MMRLRTIPLAVSFAAATMFLAACGGGVTTEGGGGGPKGAGTGSAKDGGPSGRDAGAFADSGTKDEGTIDDGTEDASDLPGVSDLSDRSDPSDVAAPQDAGADAGGTDGGVLPGLSVGPSGYYLRLDGKPVILVGDSLTQGWMELGADFNYVEYLDALSSRGLNVVMIWSYIGITDQRDDERIGYDAPEFWPWNGGPGKFDLNSLNPVYFEQLGEFVRAARARDMVVLITVHDGGVKWRFDGHPFNSALGGPLADKAGYVELDDYGAEAPAAFDPSWRWQKKNQFFQERFCERMIDTLKGFDNVMFEMFNEGEWYDQGNLLKHQTHFLSFFRKRTDAITAVNDDHVLAGDYQGNPECDVITNHSPRWDAMPPARDFFDHYVAAFGKTPPKPCFFSEPVPEFRGEADRLDALMRMAWGTALGGAGFVLQNDASFGFDTKAAIASKAAERDAALDRLGHITKVLDDPSLNIEAMRPDAAVAAGLPALCERGRMYIVYVESQKSVTLDLSDAPGAFDARFFDPKTGKPGPPVEVSGGAKRSIDKPGTDDQVLWVVIRK
ncbi:MAG: hypothetical protein HY897_24605 [Deltaproteobacteria bacterium]|nr:hypothetical protein [Deltaproteobacteria bacterium]